ncbi:hypothetical protein GcM1_156008 [Golovinomyces cichoracearum]|uniref:Uncharacterized protein n=1 Tax=Golovinomyces cichoracearum TaxID=62708 RepID=A0A420JAB1_9PEZI|nr:hypothetical protein GcM1_156008 [Golovinomyces cichoracearum]
MAYCVMSLVSQNIYLQEMCPSSFSASFYTYCSYLYYYQILRAKDEVGQRKLSRSERRVLRHLRNISEPEAWPVPTPLIELFSAFGYYKSSNTVYSYVVPSFPVFQHISCSPGSPYTTGFSNYPMVPGIQRFPPIAAYVEFLYKSGTDTAFYQNLLLMDITLRSRLKMGNKRLMNPHIHV